MYLMHGRFVKRLRLTEKIVSSTPDKAFWTFNCVNKAYLVYLLDEYIQGWHVALSEVK